MPDFRGLLLAALLLTPVVVVSATSTDLAAPDPATLPTPGTDVVNIASCLPTGMEVPLAVDECGDTMTGDLAFALTKGVVFPSGKLAGDSGLTFGGAAVCIANAPIAGCGTGDITSVTAGTCMVGGGPSGDVILSADTNCLQRRVTASCPAGQSIRAIDGIGGVTCELDDNTIYTAGSGLTLTGNQFSVNTAAIQSRVVGSCAAGQSIRAIDSAGGVTCELDDTGTGTVTSVATGAGLTGGPITTAGTVSIATGGVTGAMISPSTTITAANYLYNTPKAGSYFADPSLCVRGTSGGEPYADMQVFNSPGNNFGPGVGLTSTAAIGLYNFDCPVILPFPVGATLTITGGDMGFFDNSAGCLVGATIRTKTPFTSTSGGALFATVYDGTSATDYASTFSGPQSKAFVTSSAVSANQVIWVHAIIDQTATNTGCRFLGMLLDYTVTQA